MIQGTLCPQCGKPVMPYGRYLRETAGLPRKISKCSHCQVELKRSPAIYPLLWFGSGALVALIFYVLPRFRSWPSGWSGLGTVMILATASVFLINFCGWLFVGWRVASTPSDVSTPPSK
jgi:hypothetical protein